MSPPHSHSPPDPVMVLSASDPITSLNFSDNGTLFSGHQNGQIQEWNTKTQRKASSWQGHSDAVISLIWTDSVLISQGREGLVSIWRNESGDNDGQTTISWTVYKQIPSAKMIFCNTALVKSIHSTYLAVPCDETARIQVYKLSLPPPSLSMSITRSTSGDLSEISSSSTLEPISVKEYGMCMKICSPQTSTLRSTPKLLVGYESGVIALWNGETGDCLAQCRPHQESVMCLDSILLMEDGKKDDCETETIIGVSGSADKTIHKWTITTHGESVNFKCEQAVDATNPGFCDIKIRQDGRLFVSGGWDSASRIFTLKKLRPLAVLTYHKQSVQCLSLARDKTLVTGSKDGYIAFWDVYKNT